MGRNDGLCVHLGNLLPDGVTVICLVADDAFGVTVRDQGRRLGAITRLPWRQDETEWVAQSIYTDVDFGAEPTTTASQGLLSLTAVFFAAPAAQGWATVCFSAQIHIGTVCQKVT
jgi:hypothetical protein